MSNLYNPDSNLPASRADLEALSAQLLKLTSLLGTLLPMQVDLIDFLIKNSVIDKKAFEDFCKLRVQADLEAFEKFKEKFSPAN